MERDLGGERRRGGSMKARWLLIGSLVLAAVLAGCAGEDGKNGTDGQDGTDGAQGIQGPPGTDQCMQCHDDDWDMDNTLLPIEEMFAVSQHNLGDTYLRRSAGCARCHTNEGYQHYLANGNAPARTTSSRIGCFTCHAPHSNQNFDLRKTTATVLDLGGTYDKGASNACVVCHQSRVPVPAIAHADSNITSSRWGPHHSTQGSVLSGSGAYVFSGATYTSSAHASLAEGCVTCHMGPSVASAEGGDHTFKVAYGADPGTINRLGCTSVSGCHANWTTDAIATTAVHDFQEEIAAKLTELRTLLEDLNWVNTAGESNPGLINTTAVAGISADDRGALFNFYFIEEDFSEGVHNPFYAEAVLDATIAYLSDK
jgi:formate-dependent nitrite reductase cytochrome c552 subunit